MSYLNDLNSSTNSTKLMLLSETMKLWKPFIPPLIRPCQLLLLQALQQRYGLNGQNQSQFCHSAPRGILWLTTWTKRWIADHLRWKLFFRLSSFPSKLIYIIWEESNYTLKALRVYSLFNEGIRLRLKCLY